MNGVERVDDVVRSATASASPRPHRTLATIARAASIAIVVAATGLAGVAPAHAAGSDDIGTPPAISDGTESVDIGTAPALADEPAIYDIGTAPTPDGETAIYDIGTAPLIPVDIPAQADLGVAVVASTPSPYVDHSFSWTVQVANNGTGPALAVVLTDLVPEQVSVIGVSSTDFTCNVAGNAVTCIRSVLAAGASGQITIDVMVPNSSTPQVVTNSANITSDTADAAPTNNSASSSVETVVVQVAPPAPTATTPASPVPVTTLAEVAPDAPTPTTAAPVAAPDFTDTLPLTGSTLRPVWLGAGVALLLGVGLLAIARRRTIPAA